ncbi:hypothetical protein AB0J86_21260 [Micromonospora sp. NPDC049559]|uniref:hypothetical protein n=1 Tax=Micromonospora sp. NPDC049559 TaxID=3155923 RepID=UPI00343ACA72
MPRNTWWRFVPRNRAVGCLTILAGVVLLVGSGWFLLTGEHGRSALVAGLDVVICVLAVLMIVRAATGLAALRHRAG